MASNLAPTPKVAAAVIGGIVASALIANVTLITPDLFDGLGKWAGLVYGLTITLVMGAAGWLKSESGTPAEDPAPQPVATVEVPAAPVIDSAPATLFPAAKVEAALAAPEPVAIEPIFTPSATPAP
jgi:hypothetical protein